MYVINDYQVTELNQQFFLNAGHRGAKITNQKLISILEQMQHQPRLEITEANLKALAQEHEVEFDKLIEVLQHQLKIIKPIFGRKWPKIYLNVESVLVQNLLKETLEREYHIEIVNDLNHTYCENSLVLLYRNNYAHPDFEKMYHHLKENVYLVTAGLFHDLLMIDNLYYVGSGLPSHTSNLEALLIYLNSDLPATKNNWLHYYRTMLRNSASAKLPNARHTPVQLGFVAYALHQFLCQYTNLFGQPTPMDQINWFWQVDLTSFNVHREVATHSPFSEYDMSLSLKHLALQETG